MEERESAGGREGTSPYFSMIFSKASLSDRQAVIELCSVAGALMATGLPSLR